MSDSATPEQKLNIASYFILSSPPGEVQDVVKDVVALVNDPRVLTDDKLAAILRQYNTENLISATSPSGHEVLVSAYGQVDDSSYLDPSTGKVLKFDHRKQVWTTETDQKQVLSPQIDEYRVAVNAAMKGYIETAYHQNKVVSAIYATDDGRITICLSAKHSKLSSFWTGSIRSVYIFEVAKQGQADLSATVKMNVHYFEDGNVQLHTDFAKQLKVQVADAATTAKNVVAAIDKFESEFHGNLEELYVNMHSTTFKAMRRFLPITGVPMNWNPNVHSLANEVTK
jgi:capping protein alpha